MFWKKRNKHSQNDAIRETLFGDMPLELWLGANSNVHPWTMFASAKAKIDAKEPKAAIEILKGITNQDGLETRHYIQAFNSLKQLGYVDESPTQLLGIVVEVGIKKNAYDLLAAYRDFTARYYNFTGKGIIWERPDNSIDLELKTVLEHAEEVMKSIGPWENNRPQPVKKGIVRLNLLTSKGLQFGEAPMSLLAKDPIGARLMNASVVLMQTLMSYTENR